MLRAVFGAKGADSAAPASSGDGARKPATVLVLQGDKYDWVEILKGFTLRDGRPLRVVQTGWEDIQVHADTYSTSGVCVDVMKPARSATKTEGERYPRTVQPDFLLVRNEVKVPSFDGKNLLNGFLFGGLSSVNSLESILLFCERPAVQGQLNKLQKRLGTEAFPVVPGHFASSHRSLMYGYTFPAVVKVGSAHAGAGKMMINDHHQMSDFRSVLRMMPAEHCMVEPFIRGDCDLRIQRIGGHVRAFRRNDISGEWKTNTGTAIMEQIEVEDRWRAWTDAVVGMFGGLDIFTVDVIVEEGTGKEYILEVNGTSSGLHPDCEAEDNCHIRDILLEAMNKELCESGE